MPEHEGVPEFVGDVKNTAPEPTSVSGDTFKFKLAVKGVPIGWLGLGGHVWACVVDSKAAAALLTWYTHGGTTYLVSGF